jgi:hypothetical protein
MGTGHIFFWGVSESPLLRPPRRPRGLGPGGPLATCSLRSPPLRSLAHGRGALIGARAPLPTPFPTRPRAPGDSDTSGWLGVIRAGRAQWSKRGGRGRERARGRGFKKKKKKVLGREGTGRGDGPTVYLPALGVPAARPPPRSGIHTKWRHGRDEPRG